ncbi:MAG: DUF1178 family protein [Halobacteria archaeon]|nr:DUF1178 family protein [Halobacteria archaeon]
MFDLQCVNAHRFEGWFKNTPEFESQLTSAMIHCPVCGTEQVAKVPSVSHLNFGKAAPQQAIAPQSKPALPTQDLNVFLRRLHDHVKQNFEDVGNEFATEAKRMHYGEIEERNIRGNATKNEVEELHEEGIMAFPLLNLPDKDKLN